ncbi:MAG: diaminopimelate decarboxylase [Deinococcales bacterium]
MDDPLLHAIAGRFGTPTYVYDLDLITRRRGELERFLPRAALRYAVKANPNGAVLRHLAALGAGAEVITLGELERALRAGVEPPDILVGGPRQDAELVARSSEAGVGLASLDSADQWRTWRDHAGDVRMLVRVNPGLDPRTHEHLATGAATSKFGLSPAAALELGREVADAGLLAGFHVHAGSMIRDLAVYDAILDVLAPLYDALPGRPLVDLGGGFAVPDFPLEAFARRAQRLAAQLGARLLLEPGRFLVAESGVLLTRVLHLKRDGPTRHVVADAGMAELLRPALYGAVHPIRVVSTGAAAPVASGPEDTLDIDGPLCENADRLGRERRLPAVAAGTLLAVAEAGAYGFAMASNYASSPRPAEVAVEAGVARLVRRRESVADLWRLEIEPPP